MSDGRGWRFRDGGGEERQLSTAELRGSLASGALSADTQVWREGFDGWVRAGDVAELFPRTLTPPPPMAGDLPPPPAFLQAVQQAYEQDGIALGEVRPALPTIPGHAPAPADPRPILISAAPNTLQSPGEASFLQPPEAPIVAAPTSAPAPFLKIGSSKPTLVGVSRSALGPPPVDAMPPPPPRGPQLPFVAPPIAVDEARPTEPNVVSPPETPRSATGLEVADELHVEMNPEPPPVPRHGPHGTLALPTHAVPHPDAAPLTLPAGVVPPPDPYAQGANDLAGRPRPKLLPIVAGAMGIMALLGLIAVGRAIFRTREPVPTSTSTSTSTVAPPTTTTIGATPTTTSTTAPPTTTASPPASGLAACKQGKTPARAALRASKDVPVELLAWPAQSRFVVGFSPDGRTAAGVSVDVQSMQPRRERVPRALGKLRRVAPIAADKLIKWAVDVDFVGGKKAPPVQRPETIAVDPSYQIAIADGALVTVEKLPDPPKRLFVIPGGTLDALRSLPVPGEGVALAMRAADAIHMGFVLPDHSPRGELGKLSEAGQVGSPSLGSNGIEVAVVFAWRAAATDPWTLRWSHGPRSAPLPPAVALALPAGGPGGDVFSPAIAGLADGRWVLSWTEGSTGARSVRAITLGPDGAPIGTGPESALALSPAGASAGQATILPLGGPSVAVVFLTAAKLKGVFDLWATTLECL